MTRAGGTVYPFTAIVGQETMKRALLVNVIDPSIGGVLIRGEKGTAKSTAVRALPSLLPPIAVVDGCPYSSSPDDPPGACPWCAEQAAAGRVREAAGRPRPVVELPIGATEDRITGSFNLEAALRHGQRRFEPGLLAAANRGLLYVDEVNLLPDHLVDLILDAAAGGVHRVEREGLSVVHPARFLLVGTMNPEEGELRPQLLDRFGLAVDVAAPRDAPARTAIVRRRIAFDRQPEEFAAQWAAAEDELRGRLARAAALLPAVQVDDAFVDLIARICVRYEVDGLRADIVIFKTAAALAALDGRTAVTAADVRAAAELALPHRRRHPFDDSGFDPQPLDELLDGPPDEPPAEPSPPAAPPADGGPAERFDPQPVAPAPLPAPAGRPRAAPPAARRRGAAGRLGAARQGRVVSAIRPRGRPADLALDATLRAAAGSLPQVQPPHLRVALRQPAPARLVLFLLDTSGSMAARRRMAFAKGAVQALLLDSYRRRDRVALIAFGGAQARLVLSPTNSAGLARRRLADLPTGGRTPLASALDLAGRTLDRSAAAASPVLVLVTDGRANVSQGADPWEDALRAAGRLRQRQVAATVLDSDAAPFSLGLAPALAAALGATYQRLADLVPATTGAQRPL